MKATEFAYWLQGMFELTDPKTLDERQTELIKKHLNMVFVHDIDPSYPAEQQQALNAAHNSGPMISANPGAPKVPLHGGDPLARC